MRPQKIDDTTLLIKLMDVFRSKGYEGSSLNDLAESAGLKKASLYHRFPGGKEDIAAAVLTHSTTWGKVYVQDILCNTAIPTRLRLEKVIDHIDTLYAQGKKSCVLRTLSMDTGMPTLDNLVEVAMHTWIKGFNQLAIDIGFTPIESKQKAIQTLINIQGALIISKGLSNTTIFKNNLQNIITLYFPTA